jgi:hypothetical protein
MSTVPARHRPFVVTILAIGAGILAVLAAVHLLQAIGILPYIIGPIQVRNFSLWYAILWGLMVWIYIWLVQMLWNMEREAWLFLVLVTFFNLSLDFIMMVTGESTWTDVSVSFLLNGLILLYCLLPSTRRAFEVH